ncbi:glutathione S-transferase family protein [Actibacterium sp. 188UL27-1]|uniref:glutathione S-transferase family protein n=1 Tax=Actibacterium sp. 188UL27-1 TaxID=2786961 RepID=UPI001959F5AF|nr:glutathione S-transferase family protein [Actibacterium sp. 188UL27-1]MBM7069877.1 glutathione S-transferase family protein [Actibacterium sp. 188UL27-1]
MGVLIEGKWYPEGYDTEVVDGAFQRTISKFRNWITADGLAGSTGEGGFEAESGRYHLYVSYACPWAHRTLIFRTLKGLEEHIDVSVVSPFLGDESWTFEQDADDTTGNRLMGHKYLRDIYIASEPKVSGRVTVPVLWDKQTGKIVSNESAEIIRMFNSAFDGITGNKTDYYPNGLRDQIDAMNDRVFSAINNGVYAAGFATAQSAYNEAVAGVFDLLDELEELLARRRYLIGDALTEADWRLFTSLVRFDHVYHGHFKCNRRRVIDYPNLTGWLRELYQMPGIAQTVRLDHIIPHYYTSHDWINPSRVVAVGPETTLGQLSQRDQLNA